MARWDLHWIDKDAEQGPVFRIGDKDIYSRERKGGRVLRLAARHSPDIHYVEPAVQAFAELAEHWQAPVLYVIDPDVKKPPAARFLYEWSRRTYAEGSVDQSYMVMGNVVTKALGRLVCRMFVAGGMPIESLTEAELQRKLDAADLSVGREGFALQRGGALVPAGGVGDGAYGQLVKRVLRRVLGRGD